MPFYGREWGQVADVNHGLFQPGKAGAACLCHHHGITQTMLNKGYIRYWDEKTPSPYLYNPRQQIFVSYEDPQSLAAKCRFVRARGLGGIMFWEYTNDPSGSLLKAVNDEA